MAEHDPASLVRERRADRRAILKLGILAPLVASCAATAASPMRGSATPDVVLVPGGFHGGWCYSRVAALLRARGHRVFTPTLTGLGERSHLAHAGVDLEMHIRDVANVISWERLTDIILAGHSYGGMVITAVADRMPENIASLVYIEAAVPRDGESCLDLVPAAAREAPLQLARQATGPAMLPPPPAAAFNVNAADRAMVDALMTPHPIESLRQPLRLTGAWRRVPRKTYVRATGWPEEATRASYDRVSEDPAWTRHDVASGHDVMLDAPEALARILIL